MISGDLDRVFLSFFLFLRFFFFIRLECDEEQVAAVPDVPTENGEEMVEMLSLMTGGDEMKGLLFP